VLAAFCPPLHLSDEFAVDGFYLSSIEFRPDQLWALLWMCILVLLLTGRARPRRIFLAGLLCGLAFSVSMKTTLLLVALALGLAGALLVRRAAGGFDVEWARLLGRSGAGVAGILIAPALIILYFYTHGAVQPLYDCVIRHNILPGSNSHGLSNGSIKCCLAGLAAALIGGYIISRLGKPIAVRTRIGFVYFAALFYLTVLRAFWPVITEEDYLPFYPVMMLSVAPALVWLATVAMRNVYLPGPLLAGAEMIAILVTTSPFQDQTVDKIGMVADTLKLTTPTDFVMDSKGETIYRNRPYPYVFESRTFHRIKMGIIPDDVPAYLVKTRTPLAASTFRMPHKGRDFIKANYVPIAFRLRALGLVLRGAGMAPSKRCYFHVAVPQRYTLVTPEGSAAGVLDGTPFIEPRELASGNHVFVPEGSPDRLILIWANVVERGYTPFAKIKEDRQTPQD